MDNRPTSMMIEHLNLKLKEDGSCLRYIKDNTTEDLVAYNLTVVDKYVDKKYSTCTTYTDEFDAEVRHFFQKHGIKNTGYWNTVATLIGKD